MLSCFPSRRGTVPETTPLLPQYDENTILQHRIHQKLHSYQMIRALTMGYMPSTDQLIVNLRTLVASDALDTNAPGLSRRSRLLLKHLKQWLGDFIEMLHNKSNQDQFQEFIWAASHARVPPGIGDINPAKIALDTRKDVANVYECVATIWGLLLTNSDFRLFLHDLNMLGRQVLADTANELSVAAETAAAQVEPPNSQSGPPKESCDDRESVPTTGDILDESTEVADSVIEGIKSTGHQAQESLRAKISCREGDNLLFRLSSAVTKLRNRHDYARSVSTIGALIKYYAKVYSRVADSTVDALQRDLETNGELDKAMRLGWQFLSSFCKKEIWDELTERLKKVADHAYIDDEFDKLMEDLASSIQEMFMDPRFFESPFRRNDDIVGYGTSISPLRKDIDRLLDQARLTCESITNDNDVSKMIRNSLHIWNIISPAQSGANDELLVDAYSVFMPLLIQTIQYIPILRLEVSEPGIDLLVENLILEPGRTINNTSFMPFKLNINTNNDLTICKARYRTISNITSLVTINVQGLSIRADEVGYWLRAYKGFLSLADEGIASLELDDRGIDISIDFEIGKDRLEKILCLRGAKVRIHHLNYSLRRSKFSCVAWLLRPFLRRFIRRILEKKLSGAIEDGIHAANRELVYARERLRATRISDPKDLHTFARAILTRLTPVGDPDSYTNIGIVGGANEQSSTFAGIYAPGSIVKLWRKEAQEIDQRVENNGVLGWRNEIFDVQTRP